MRVFRKQSINDVIKQNLLSAHKRIADHGSVSDIIRFTKFLMSLIEKTDDVLIEIVPECNKDWCGEPVDHLK